VHDNFVLLLNISIISFFEVFKQPFQIKIVIKPVIRGSIELTAIINPINSDFFISNV